MNINHPYLQLSNEKVKEILNVIPNPVFVWQRKEGDLVLVDYNKAAEVITEFKVKELINLKATEIYIDRPEMIKDLNRCLNEKLNFSKEVKYKFISTGMNKTLYVTLSYISPDFVFVYTEDITEQKKGEAYLKKSETEKSIILASISELIVFQDLDNNIIRANKAAADSVQKKLPQLIGQKCFSIWHNRDTPCEICPVNRTVETSQIETDSIASPDGRNWIITGYPVFDNSEKLVGVVEVANDVTERIKAQLKIKESEEKYRSLFENMTAAFAYHEVVTDENNKPIDYKYVEANSAFEKLTSLKLDDLIGKNVTEVLPGIENDPADWIGRFGEVGLTGIPLSIEDYSEPLDRWYKVSGYSPKKGFFAVTFTDITNRKKTEEKLKESEKKYRDAFNRSNLYKDIFTHDINNILQNVLSSLELSKAFSHEVNKKLEYEEVMNLINRQIIRGKKLVKNIQTLSQVDKYKEDLSSIEILNMLEKTVKILKENNHDKTVDITITASQDEYYIKANKSLRKIFDNILDNAVYHNGSLLIEIVISISKERKDETDFIKFEFIDNGIGIPDPMKDSIFTREIKENDIPSGIGLGLLLVKRLVESYNGEIRVQDRIIGDHTKGSKFIVLIPEKQIH